MSDPMKEWIVVTLTGYEGIHKVWTVDTEYDNPWLAQDRLRALRAEGFNAQLIRNVDEDATLST